jgi:hypothetical protein
MYEDDGRSNAHRQGGHALMELGSGEVVVRIGAPTGKAPVMGSGPREVAGPD